MEAARCMLHEAGLPSSFWAEALATAVYLRNRSPTSAVDGATPYEKWYGSKPDLQHLRVFGCAAYGMVPKGQRRKLDPKAKKLIMVGYSTQHKDGYRLYDPETRQIVIRGDVVWSASSKGASMA